MNLPMNPLNSMSLLKNYILDIGRIERLSHEQLKRYRDKKFKQIVKYAYAVPLYHDKYKKVGIHPSDIKGITDINKLPFITKNDLREYYPDGIIPTDVNKEKISRVGTSGSTGKPMFMYKDFHCIAKDGIGYLKLLKTYRVKWNRDKITHIGDFSIPRSSDEESEKMLMKYLTPFFSLKNLQNLFAGENLLKLIKKIENFNPDIITAYPGTLRELSILKRNGMGNDISPRLIISGGGVLDKYTKRYVEETFDARIIDWYVATETGTIAFECPNGNFHVQSDLVHLEFVDDNRKPVSVGKSGYAVVTRLYGGGTPIIRYTGMDDIVTSMSRECNCGASTPLIRKIDGRKAESIILPDGRVFPPATITLIPVEVMFEFNIRHPPQFQLVQTNSSNIEILLLFDDSFTSAGQINRIQKEIKDRYEELIGPSVSIKVKVVKRFQESHSISSVVSSKEYYKPLIINKGSCSSRDIIGQLNKEKNIKNH